MYINGLLVCCMLCIDKVGLRWEMLVVGVGSERVEGSLDDSSLSRPWLPCHA